MPGRKAPAGLRHLMLEMTAPQAFRLLVPGMTALRAFRF